MFKGSITIGVLGGGQLGRMLIQSAIDFNFELRTLDPDPDAPCKHISHFQNGSLKDFDTVYQFGKQCDIVTIEIEAVNVEALKKLASEGIKVFPQPEVLEIIQDKRLQKTFYNTHGIPTAPFVLTENRADVSNYLHLLPAVHKLGKDGYDGRGVQMIRTEVDLALAFDAPGVLESLVDFEKELAVIVSRNERGEVACFPVVEMVFNPVHNLVEYLFAPANIPASIAEKAQQVALKVAAEFKIVGLLAVEMFLTKQGEILVNEVAPRPHNSGHHTIEANHSSQYEQLLRAIVNLPLGDTSAVIPAAMLNLLGEVGYSGPAYYEGMETILQLGGVHLHLYGKKLTKPFRKMGHVTVCDTDLDSLAKKINVIQQTLKVKA